jgi:hypothetical protein
VNVRCLAGAIDAGFHGPAWNALVESQLEHPLLRNTPPHSAEDPAKTVPHDEESEPHSSDPESPTAASGDPCRPDTPGHRTRTPAEADPPNEDETDQSRPEDGWSPLRPSPSNSIAASATRCGRRRPLHSSDARLERTHPRSEARERDDEAQARPVSRSARGE